MSTEPIDAATRPSRSGRRRMRDRVVELVRVRAGRAGSNSIQAWFEISLVR
jgi:hypothetical protein